ncbi:energy transducer TonB [Dechloromonas denitrificans]|nr:energy transducer TonB [Dechloromonas denitrificans]UCV10174.1 energy transducer TonB [Dechloromonas denitrificans]
MRAEQAVPSPTFSVPAPSAAPPAPPAAAPTASAAPVTVTPARFDAAYLHNPEPKYPPLSRRLGEEGKVLLRVRVSRDGQPATIDFEKSSNFERLDEAAKQVVARWRFIPAKRGDEAIEASVIIPIVFRLDG